MFELSRDYKKAFELIKNGDRIACFLDYEGCRDVAANIPLKWSRGVIDISARGISYIYLFEDQAKTSEMFERQCDRLNVEFFLPMPDDTILIISPERFEAIASKVIQEKVGKPLDKLIESLEAIA